MARSFNGTSDWIDGGLVLPRPTAGTISAWAYLTNVTVSNYQYVYGFDGTTSQLTIYKDISGAHFIYFAAATASVSVVGSSTLTNNKWYHVCLTYDSVGGLKTFINGVSDGTAAANGALNTADVTTHHSAGAEVGGTTNALPGRVADCAQWNVVLTANEILALSRGERPGNIRRASLQQWLPLDGLASPEPDYSGSKFNGTLTGTAFAAGPPLNLFTPRREVIQPPVTGLPAGDQFFDLAPITSVIPVSLRTWTAAYSKTLIGKDKLPAGDQFWITPPPLRDPPAPSITASYNLSLIGKDKLPIGDQWWILPAPQPIQATTWTQDPLPLLLPTAPQLPKNQYDWPTPTAFPQLTRGVAYSRPIFTQGPFNQFDWPLTISRHPQETGRSWTASYTWTLLGKDILPTGRPVGAEPLPAVRFIPPSDYTWLQQSILPIPAPIQFIINQDDWPLPKAPQWDDYTWLQQGILTLPQPPVQPPFAQYDWPVPIAPQPANDLRTFVRGVLGSPVLPPFAQYDWPLPGRYTTLPRSITASYNLDLIGKDVITVGEQYFDRPADPPWQITRSITASYNLNLIGKDKLPAGDQYYDRTPIGPTWLGNWVTSISLALITLPPQVPKNQYAWPLPGAITWRANDVTASYNPNLIGQDKLPTGEQYSERPPGPVWLANWITSTSVALLTTIPPPQLPKNQFDWPLPGINPQLTRGALYNRPLATQGPLNQFDWPLAISRHPGLDRSWTASYLQTLVGQDRLPAGARVTDLADQSSRQTWLANWINSTSLALLTGPVPQKPFKQTDWPLPIAARQPDRSYGAIFPRVLIGKDRLPIRQQDWPLPGVPRPAADLITFINRSQIQLIGKDKLPSRQQDWPVPKERPLLARGTLYNRPIGAPGALVVILPRNQRDWPLPKGHADAYYASMIARITNGRVLSGGIPPFVPPPGVLDHVRAFADSYYGVMYAEEVTRGRPEFAEHKGKDFKRAGN